MLGSPRRTGSEPASGRLEGRELARWLRPTVGAGAVVAPGFLPRWFFSVAVVNLSSVSSSRPSIRACGSPAHGLPTPFTASIRSLPPGLAGPGRDDDSVEVDQAVLVRSVVE